ncbi:DOMON-like domain-containing protein [Novosphingobium album (ex Liu et al. 2023)]|uniref:DOMON-like domain-containing protein n=1 Tax=Novosphingobium album (ex Liu et al. 2023) TaxID=3031130 RepID=A0ABT5WKX2_9SPHN|nr:DOMON-like domain-containing protein [Novosphingobium album (ex Liu et al. 2023)]MDE8650691.1 DOMON-like domain-containing protein [Novosphingobium album (ex Liu et al. 2023)]
MQTHTLIPHLQSPPLAVQSVSGRITSDGAWLRLRWRIDGPAALVVPPFAGKGRADGLWQTTCFELFLRAPDESAYLELNLSPSERWNAYDFTGYRAGMAERPMPIEPTCSFRVGQAMAIFDAAVPLSALPPRPWHAAMSAVLEEEGGIKSYWALAHQGDRPDFHDPACFVIDVPAPEAP